MAIMIDGVRVAQGAPAGTRIGNLRVYFGGVAITAGFALSRGSTGLFAISGNALVTNAAAAVLPVGYYAISIKAVGSAHAEKGRFIIQVTAPPPAPPPPPAS